MKQRIALTLILLTLVLYTGFQATVQVQADRTFDDYELYLVSTGQDVPGTNLKYEGAEQSQSTDYNESVTLHFLDDSNKQIDLGPLIENDVLRNNVIFGEVMFYEDEFQVIGLAITVKVPRVPRGTFMDRLWTRMINPFGGG